MKKFFSNRKLYPLLFLIGLFVLTIQGVGGISNIYYQTMYHNRFEEDWDSYLCLRKCGNIDSANKMYIRATIWKDSGTYYFDRMPLNKLKSLLGNSDTNEETKNCNCK